MAFSKSRFKITLWGPKKLRDIFKDEIQKEINERTPLEGLGIVLSQESDGIRVSTKAAKAAADAGSDGGGGGGGSTVNLYGAFNGAPALFHLLQSSPPTQPPP